MKQATYILFWCLLGFLCQAESYSDTQPQCIRLNNEGVKALNTKDWQSALDKFEAALKLDPNYSLAQKNLTVLHGQHGVELRQEHRFADALKELHQAAYEGSYWEHDVAETIEKMGKNPGSYEDRIELAGEAGAIGDNMGAVVEYRAALRVKNDAQVHKKLGDVYNLLGKKFEATAEYETAKRVERRTLSPVEP